MGSRRQTNKLEIQAEYSECSVVKIHWIFAVVKMNSTTAERVVEKNSTMAVWE
jgi:hypothetical protein